MANTTRGKSGTLSNENNGNSNNSGIGMENNISGVQLSGALTPSASSSLLSLPLPESLSTSSNQMSAPFQQTPRPSSTARGNVAAFLTKLYNMVSDEASNNLIRWSEDGHSFIVLRHVEFAKEVLPKFFKHNNFSSFVRQLNMYGFHKVPHLQQGVLLPEADTEQWEFSNPHFQKNQPDLLCLVSRKKASASTSAGSHGSIGMFEGGGGGEGGGGEGGGGSRAIRDDSSGSGSSSLMMDLNHILQEVSAIKKHQVAISADLKSIERDHQQLWTESVSARDRHQRQQETIDKILRFLASVFSADNNNKRVLGNKKPRLTIMDGETVDGEDDEDEIISIPTTPSLGSRAGSAGRHSSLARAQEEEEEEIGTPPLGNKRKREASETSIASSLNKSNTPDQAGCALPGLGGVGGQGATMNQLHALGGLTPAALAMLANANQATAVAPGSLAAPSSANTLGFVPTTSAVPLTTANPGLSSFNMGSTLPETSTSASNMAAVSGIAGGATPLYSSTTGMLPDYLTAAAAAAAAGGGAFPSILNYDGNGNILTSLGNNNNTGVADAGSIAAMHADFLKSMAAANASAIQQAQPQMPFPQVSSIPVGQPLGPTFAETPDGAHTLKSVEDITREMEELQKSIESLKQHGLNFDFDSQQFLDLSGGSAMDSSGLDGLSGSTDDAAGDHVRTGSNAHEGIEDLIRAHQSQPQTTLQPLSPLEQQQQQQQWPRESDLDELNFITPALQHQHLSSGQATPVMASTPGASTPVVAPVGLDPTATLATAIPENDLSSLNTSVSSTPLSLTSSPPLPTSPIDPPHSTQ